MGKYKSQGTRFESWIVERLSNSRFLTGVERLAEGGNKDRGDVRVYDRHAQEWVVEAKARERLNVPREMAKARSKSGTPRRTVLVWKRLVKAEGKKRRVTDGEAVVVVMGWDTYMDLLER